MVNWSFKACATRLDSRKQLKDSTSKSTSRLTIVSDAWHGSSGPFATRLLSLLKESPMNMAAVKKEFTLTTSSSAVTSIWISSVMDFSSCSSVSLALVLLRKADSRMNQKRECMPAKGRSILLR